MRTSAILWSVRGRPDTCVLPLTRSRWSYQWERPLQKMWRQESCERSEDSWGACGQRNEARAKNNLRWRSWPGAWCGARRYRPRPAREGSRGRSAFTHTSSEVQPNSELSFYGKDRMNRSNEENPKPSHQQTAASWEYKFKQFNFHQHS